jgi:hypothetical protein
MQTRTLSSSASLEQTARVHDLAKLQALQLRRVAVGQFWAAVFARVAPTGRGRRMMR